MHDNISFLFQTISYSAPNPEADPEPYAVADGTKSMSYIHQIHSNDYIYISLIAKAMAEPFQKSASSSSAAASSGKRKRITYTIIPSKKSSSKKSKKSKCKQCKKPCKRCSPASSGSGLFYFYLTFHFMWLLYEGLRVKVAYVNFSVTFNRKTKAHRIVKLTDKYILPEASNTLLL